LLAFNYLLSIVYTSRERLHWGLRNFSLFESEIVVVDILTAGRMRLVYNGVIFMEALHYDVFSGLFGTYRKPKSRLYNGTITIV
jgi:hypothetical protein